MENTMYQNKKCMFCRLTPLYAYVILFNATLWNFTGSGPLWKATIAPQVKGCRETWYLNLLYIHNYVKDGEWVSFRVNIYKAPFAFSACCSPGLFQPTCSSTF